MTAANRPIARAGIPCGAGLMGGLLAVLLLFAPSRAQEPAQPADDGAFITVNNPITSEVKNRVVNLAEEARAGKNGKVIGKIIFDFNPNEKSASSADFGPCYDLAKYIRGLHNITTVAYVHQTVSRHTVLPVLACKELVMGGAETSGIGKIIEDPKGRLDPQDARVYEDFAGEARAAIVQKMYDAGVELMKGRRNNAEFYFDRRRQADAVAAGVVGAESVKPAGDLLFLNTDEALKYGVCKLGHKANRRQVAEYYGLSLDSLRTDPLRGKAPKARLVVLKGEISHGMKESVMRRIYRAREDDVNTFIVQLQDCGNGSLSVARDMAEEFVRLTEDEKDPVQIIAFIPYQAPDTAAIVALGCSEIVMSDDATLGDFGRLVNVNGPGRGGVDVNAVKAILRGLMDQRNYDPAIGDALVDQDVELYRVRSRKGAFERRLMTGDELAGDQKLADPLWQVENQIKHRGKALVLDSRLASELHIARHVVKGRDVKEVYGVYGLKESDVKEITPDWLDQIALFLRHPAVRFLLVMVGITCLILEFKIPGATAPGVIAAICFVLFFWAQSHLSGQIIILAILLFLLGLILIGIEIFVLPGFGFVGVSGILLMVIGLGLATVERMPHSSADWLDLGAKFSQFGLGIVLAGFAAIILARYLPNIPVANRMVLTPPTDHSETGDEPPALPGVEQAAALLGVIGTAATTLRPAGMAMFGEQYVDVVTEGSFIPAGARVQVIEVEGNRIVVKEV